MTATLAAAPGFASLAELQAKHAALAKVVGKDILVPANLERIAQFVRKGIATGTVLDAPTDRAAAQSLISFWTTRLASASRDLAADGSHAKVPELEDTLLAEFDSDVLVTTVITPSDEWFDRQSESDQTLTRRLVLRLVALREGGRFEVVSSASGVCEGLEPRDRADEVLAELLRLGVVRSTRNPSGTEEFALGSAELLNRWPRLKEWTAERKRFREKASKWAQRRVDRDADPSRRSFVKRAEKAFGVVVQQFGGWIETRWRALRAPFKTRGPIEEFLSEAEYEEAETYRDKNVVEITLVYQKRQHDKERQERERVRAVLSAVAASIFAGLFGVAVLGWFVAYKKGAVANEAKRTEAAARMQEEAAKERAFLQLADFISDKGAQSEVDDRDVSGAFLWYAAAWDKFDDSKEVLKSTGDKERLHKSYLLQLSAARERLPFLCDIAYQKDMLASARTPNGRFLLTISGGENGAKSGPVVRYWRRPNVRQGRDEWAAATLPWGERSPGDAFASPAPYLSRDGRFAVVSRAPRVGEVNSAVYVWTIPETGPTNPAEELKGFEGAVTAAEFSPDGQFFAAVSQLNNEGKVYLWQSGRWSDPIKLAVPPDIGQPGQLAFCPGSSERLAVALTPVQPTPGKDRVICLEWIIDASRLASPILRRYASPPHLLWGSPQGEIQTFVTYKPDGRVLLVSNSSQHSPRASVWLFDSSRENRPAEGPSVPWFLYPAGPLIHAAFSPSDDRLVIASADGNATLFSSQSNRESEKHHYEFIRALPHKAQIFRADFSPDGRYIVTASRDCRALVWDVDSGQLAHPSFHHSASVIDAGFLDDGRSLITSTSNMICRWDLTRGEGRPLPMGTVRGVLTTSADPEGNLLVTAGKRETRSEDFGAVGWARVWDAVTGDPHSPELQHPTPVLHAAISGPSNGLVSTVTSNGVIRLWNATSGRLLWTSDQPKEGPAVFTAFGEAANGIHLLAIFRSDTQNAPSASYLRIYRLNPEGEPKDKVQPLRVHAPFAPKEVLPFTSAAFDRSCEYVIAIAGDGADSPGNAVVLEVQTGKITALKGRGTKGTAHDEAITHAEFSGDGKYSITTGRDDKAIVWDLREGSQRELPPNPATERGHTADVEFGSFDRTGARVVTAGADGWAIVWERAPDKNFHAVQKLRNERSLTHSVFSADDQYALTADMDGTTRLWDINDGRPVVTKYHPDETILQLVFPRDVGGDARVRVIGHQRSRSAMYSGQPGQMPRSSGVNSSVGVTFPVITELRLNSPVDTSVEADRNLAKWTASRELVNRRDIHAELNYMAHDVIFDLWQKSADQRKLTVPSSVEAVCRWHEREAARCELDGRWSSAIGHWDRAIDSASKRRLPILHARRAHVYSELSDWANAEADLDKALTGITDDSELWRARANARIQLSHTKHDQNKQKEAASDYRRALQVNQDNNLARAQFASALVEARQFSEALAEFDQAVRRDENNPDLRVKRALAYLKSGDSRLAYDDYVKAGELFKARKFFDDADKAYSGAVGLFKDGVESSAPSRAKIHAELAEVQENRANVTFNNKQQRASYYQAAGEHYLNATTLDDKVETYWSGLARCREHLGEWKAARLAFEKALELNPENPMLTESRARSLVQLKEWDEAAKAYQAITDREKTPTLLNRLRLAAIYLQPVPPEKVASPERLKAASLCLAEATHDEYLSQQSLLWLHLAVVQLAEGKISDYEATRTRMFEAIKMPLVNDWNNVAWSAAFARSTPEDAERAIKLAGQAVAVSPQNYNYLNTHGAVLYRGGRREQAIENLQEATKQRKRAILQQDELAYGNALDLLFEAMAQFTPEKPEQARKTWNTALQTIDDVKAAQQVENPERSLERVWERLEFEVLRREAEKLINR
jgi:WD40 repeat protein/tetratricopeptide (TPR) repeat protein